MRCEICGVECGEVGECSTCGPLQDSAAEGSHIARITPKKIQVELSETEREVLKRQRAEYEAGKVVRDAGEHRRELGVGERSKLPLLLLFIAADLLLLAVLLYAY